MTILEGLFIVFCVAVAAPNLSKFGTLGTVQAEIVFDPVTMTNTVNDFDNSFTILIFSIVSILIIVAFTIFFK